jgi:hypothetical protein
MLLNEFLKEHKKVQQLEVAVTKQQEQFDATIADLRKEVERVAARSENQETKIQKVNTKVDLRAAASRAVANRQ